MSRTGRAALALFAGALALAAIPALAQTVYKLIARDGKVTYSESPPKDFDGRVIRIDIDPNANKATLGPSGGGVRHEPAAKPEAGAPSVEDQLKAARERLEEARKELAAAREHPRDDEIRFIGNAHGGTRPVPTEAYEKRIALLEHEVKEAEHAVSELEKR